MLDSIWSSFASRLVFSATLVVGVGAGVARADGGTIAGDVAARPQKLRGGVVVHVDKVAGSFRPAARPVVIDQKGMTFLPHVVAIVKGSSVTFSNSDAVRHNVFTPDGEKYNLGTWAQGETKTHVFKDTGVFQQLCNIHPEMLGYVVVLDNPYFAVTGPDGKFEIKNVPPGSYTVKIWSEKFGETSRPVTVAADGTATLHVELGAK